MDKKEITWITLFGCLPLIPVFLLASMLLFAIFVPTKALVRLTGDEYNLTSVPFPYTDTKLPKNYVPVEERGLRLYLPDDMTETGHIQGTVILSAHRRSRYPEAEILPVTERRIDIDVFVGQIDAAREAYLSVDNKILPVCAVIKCPRQCRDLVEREKIYPPGSKVSCFLPRESSDRSQIVVDELNVHALCRFTGKDVNN